MCRRASRWMTVRLGLLLSAIPRSSSRSGCLMLHRTWVRYEDAGWSWDFTHIKGGSSFFHSLIKGVWDLLHSLIKGVFRIASVWDKCYNIAPKQLEWFVMTYLKRKIDDFLMAWKERFAISRRTIPRWRLTFFSGRRADLCQWRSRRRTEGLSRYRLSLQVSIIPIYRLA